MGLSERNFVKQITNEEYELALGNKDNLRIMWRVTSRYKLDRDEAHCCRLDGLWKALATYNGTRKFTSHLYDCVKYKCLHMLKKKKKQKWNYLHYDPSRMDVSYEMEDYIEQLEEPEMFKDRFLNGMTIEDIAKKNHMRTTVVSDILYKSKKDIINFINE